MWHNMFFFWLFFSFKLEWWLCFCIITHLLLTHIISESLEWVWKDLSRHHVVTQQTLYKGLLRTVSFDFEGVMRRYCSLYSSTASCLRIILLEWVYQFSHSSPHKFTYLGVNFIFDLENSGWKKNKLNVHFSRALRCLSWSSSADRIC